MLYIDCHEPQDIIDMLKRRNLAVEVRHIDSGDYIMGNLAIERKTIQDLINSVTSGERHMWTQLETMRNTYEQQILLIEGTIDYKDRLLMGILTTIILFWKYQTIFSKDKNETVEWIERLYTKFGINRAIKEPPIAVIRSDTPEDIRWAMCQTVKGIGSKIAREIIKNNPKIFSIEQPINPNLNIKGIRKESKDLLMRVLNGE